MRPLLMVLAALGIGSGAQEVTPGRVVCVRASESPTIDGKDDDDAWKVAKALAITVKRPLAPNLGASTEASVRSVRTDTHVYFVVRWRDETKDDVAHKP